MKSLDEVKQLKKQFLQEYGSFYVNMGNRLSAGVGKDPLTNDLTIEARLENDKFKSALPDTYHGIKVNVSVIGKIRAL